MKRVVLLIAGIALFSVAPVFAQSEGWIGVRVEDQENKGVVVRSVETDSPASKAGLRQNDVIVRFDRQDVTGVRQLTRLVQETPVGRAVDIAIKRDNKEQVLKITTARAPENAVTERLPNFDRDTLRDLRDRVGAGMPFGAMGNFAGLQVLSLTPQLREFFGAKTGEGVLVAEVDANSPASRAGLRAGDVIIAVNGKTVSAPMDLVREFRSARTALTVKVLRDKREREFSVERVRPRDA